MNAPNYLVYKATPLPDRDDVFETLTATERTRRAPFRWASRTSDGGGVFYLPLLPEVLENHRLYELGNRIETLEARAYGIAVLKAVDFTDDFLSREEIEELVIEDFTTQDQVA